VGRAAARRDSRSRDPVLRRADPPTDAPRAIGLTPPEFGAPDLSLNHMLGTGETPLLVPDIMDRGDRASHVDLLDPYLVG
jgi:hypothetical protein